MVPGIVVGSAASPQPKVALRRAARRVLESWWSLRRRSQATYRTVVRRLPYAADELISISPQLEEVLPQTL